MHAVIAKRIVPQKEKPDLATEKCKIPLPGESNLILPRVGLPLLASYTDEKYWFSLVFGCGISIALDRRGHES